MPGPKFLPLILLLFSCTAVFSQTRPETIIVGLGEDPYEVLPPAYRYLNKDYKDGYLAFQMGVKSGVFKFNFDFLSNKLVFINEKKDTMVVQEDVTVKYLHLGKDIYYHDVQQGYFKVLGRDTLGMLASHVLFEHYVPTQVGYGTVKHKTTAIVNAGRGQAQTFERSTQYVLIDNRGSISPYANKIGFLKMFHNGEDQIIAFMKENKISFKKEADLVKLFEFCHSLRLKP